MKAAIHNGHVAFYLDDDVNLGDPMNAQKAYNIDGEHPDPTVPIRCSSCGDNENLKVTIDWEDTSHAIQRERDEEEKPDETRLPGLSLAKG